MIDYYKIIYEGYHNESDRNFLEEHFIRVFQEYRKNNYNIIQITSGLAKILNSWKEVLDENYSIYKLNLYKQESIGKSKKEKFSISKKYEQLYDNNCLIEIEYQLLNNKHIRKIGIYDINLINNALTNAIIKLNLEKIINNSPLTKKGVKKSQVFDNIESIFNDINKTNDCISILKTIQPPIISDENEYILGVRSKGAITAWLKILYKYGFIKQVNDDILSNVLNNTFKGLNLGSGRTLRNYKTTAYNKYYKKIEAELKSQM